MMEYLSKLDYASIIFGPLLVALIIFLINQLYNKFTRPNLGIKVEIMPKLPAYKITRPGDTDNAEGKWLRTIFTIEISVLNKSANSAYDIEVYFPKLPFPILPETFDEHTILKSDEKMSLKFDYKHESFQKAENSYVVFSTPEELKELTLTIKCTNKNGRKSYYSYSYLKDSLKISAKLPKYLNI